jgi:hypothetical protein
MKYSNLDCKKLSKICVLKPDPLWDGPGCSVRPLFGRIFHASIHLFSKFILMNQRTITDVLPKFHLPLLLPSSDRQLELT